MERMSRAGRVRDRVAGASTPGGERPLVTQLPWSHHLIILGQSKRPEEREFYVRLAIHERWSKRELERQFKTGLFERVVLSPPKVSPSVTQMYPTLRVFPFLRLPGQL